MKSIRFFTMLVAVNVVLTTHAFAGSYVKQAGGVLETATIPDCGDDYQRLGEMMEPMIPPTPWDISAQGPEDAMLTKRSHATFKWVKDFLGDLPTTAYTSEVQVTNTRDLHVSKVNSLGWGRVNINLRTGSTVAGEPADPSE